MIVMSKNTYGSQSITICQLLSILNWGLSLCNRWTVLGQNFVATELLRQLNIFLHYQVYRARLKDRGEGTPLDVAVKV